MQGQAPSTIFAAGQGTDPASRYAPAFFVYESDTDYNRIGMPSARLDESGAEEVFIDPDRAVIYVGRFAFSTEKGSYSNLVYRVHFASVPLRHITAGNNGGLMVAVTLNAQEQPVLVSTFGTCGCYLAITPTNFLPDSALPEGFRRDMDMWVYGETLPGNLDYARFTAPQLLVTLRPGVHRVMDLAVVEQESLAANGDATLHKAGLAPMQSLERLELANGAGTTSFYHEKGLMQGYVKGAIKPWESLFMSGLALDFFVGTDKAYYGDPKRGRPFYTSLKPWYRAESDVRDYGRFLAFWGWRL